MSYIEKEVYSELIEILNYIEIEYIEKIPKKLREFFENNGSDSYVPHINPAIPLKDQDVNYNTLVLLALLDLNYWYETEEERQKMIRIYNENEEKYQEELRKKYNPDNIFKKKT